jgi:hypothetical protein
LKSVREIREVLRRIEGALVRHEPERAEQGELEGVKELWDPDHSRAGIDTLPRAPQPEEEEMEDGEPGQLEELIEFAPPAEHELINALGGAANAEKMLRSKLVTDGIDALGWYVSFHRIGIQWGISIPITGIVLTAVGTFGALECNLQTKLTLALRLIHQHELFHFAIDYACAQLEVLRGRPVWLPAQKSLRGPEGYNVQEEKAANAWMLRSLWRGKKDFKLKGRSEAVREFVKLQPKGYRDAPQVTLSSRFFSEVESLVRRYGEASKAFDDNLLGALDGARLLPFDPYIDWRSCPIHIIHDEKRLNLPHVQLDLLRLAQEISETESFQKALSKLSQTIQRAWQKTREKILVDTTLPGLNFKPFLDGGERVYSVRLNNRFRAHLRRLPQGCLEAFRVGDHREMGHG